MKAIGLLQNISRFEDLSHLTHHRPTTFSKALINFPVSANVHHSVYTQVDHARIHATKSRLLLHRPTIIACWVFKKGPTEPPQSFSRQQLKLGPYTVSHPLICRGGLNPHVVRYKSNIQTNRLYRVTQFTSAQLPYMFSSTFFKRKSHAPLIGRPTNNNEASLCRG